MCRQYADLIHFHEVQTFQGIIFVRSIKIPEDTVARKLRRLTSVQIQLDSLRKQHQQLQDELSDLRASNVALREQCSSSQDNAKLVVDLREQLALAAAKCSSDQITANIASFNCQQAEAVANNLQASLHDKIISENHLREQCDVLSTERDTLLGILNEIRARFAWELPAFHSTADLVPSSQRLIDDLSKRFIVPGSTFASRIVGLEVELDELRTANIEYAREARKRKFPLP